MKHYNVRKWFGRWAIELALGGWHASWRLSFDEDITLTLSFLVGVVFLSFYPKGKWFHRFWTMEGAREISFVIYAERIMWRLWGNPMVWHSTTPRWKDGSFDWVEFLLGKLRYSEALVGMEDVTIPMPERAYAGVAKKYSVRRYYSRWPWRKIRSRIEIVMNPGEDVPCPGKGENSWDCDEDATHSFSTNETTVEAAVEVMTRSCLRTRQQRGGEGWRPQAAP